MMLEGPTAGVFMGREHQLPLRVYYEDTDFTGLVYHASYVRFFERGRSDYLRLAGVDHVAMAAVGTAFAVVNLNVAFKAAARIDDSLVVCTTFEAVRGARILIAQKIVRERATLTTAEVEVVCIDPQGRARRPPAELVETLKPLLG